MVPYVGTKIINDDSRLEDKRVNICSYKIREMFDIEPKQPNAQTDRLYQSALSYRTFSALQRLFDSKRYICII